MNRLLAFLLLPALAACSDVGQYGGLTADIVWGGPLRQALRTALIPGAVGTLRIQALDAESTVLAETTLSMNLGEADGPLDPMGGEWRLDGVPVGRDRSILAEAFPVTGFGSDMLPPAIFRGRIDGIEVRAGETQNVGELVLEPLGANNRMDDVLAPLPPEQVQATPLPAGEAIRVTFLPPMAPDLAGVLVAIGTSSIAELAPPLERGRTYEPATPLTPDLVVRTVWRVGQPPSIDIDGLTDGVATRVVLYAFDDDGLMGALNYSRPVQASATPTDTLGPGVATQLSGRLVAPDEVEVEFVAPPEDANGGGIVLGFEVRASTSSADLRANFDALPAVEAPVAQPPNTTVVFRRALSSLQASAGAPLFIGVRARDAAENVGEIATAEVALTSSATPSLTEITPPIGLAGSPLTLTGGGFGTTRGTVTLTPSETATVTVSLSVSRWTSTEITASLPATARTGRLTVRRADGAAVDTPLSVLFRVVAPLPRREAVFDAVGVGSDNPARSALYSERSTSGGFESAVTRFIDGVEEGVPQAPSNHSSRSSAVAGTYDQVTDRFLFVASNSATRMTTALTTSSTESPDAFRLQEGVLAGAADRVAVVITGGGSAGAVPAMLAFTRDGTLRTATVADARTQSFDGFFASTSSTGASYSGARLAKDRTGALLLAYRTQTGTVSTLALFDNVEGRSPSAFVRRDLATPPSTTDRLELLAAPVAPGQQERFVVAFEHVLPDDTTEVRLVWADDAGTRLGIAPHSPGERRLEDAGLVLREGEVFVALLTSQISGPTSRSLMYTEVPVAALSGLPDSTGAWPGVVLDSAPVDYQARLACKPYLQATCDIFWLGDGDGALFIRR